jgi:hypothetical protein
MVHVGLYVQMTQYCQIIFEEMIICIGVKCILWILKVPLSAFYPGLHLGRFLHGAAVRTNIGRDVRLRIPEGE